MSLNSTDKPRYVSRDNINDIIIMSKTKTYTNYFQCYFGSTSINNKLSAIRLDTGNTTIRMEGISLYDNNVYIATTTIELYLQTKIHLPIHHINKNGIKIISDINYMSKHLSKDNSIFNFEMYVKRFEQIDKILSNNSIFLFDIWKKEIYVMGN